MSAYLLSPAAQADLEDIWEYTSENWSADQAETYVVGPHTLYHRIARGDLIDVVRVAHKRRKRASPVALKGPTEDCRVSWERRNRDRRGPDL